MRMGGNRELLDGKNGNGIYVSKWEWEWEWEWDGNGNKVTEMGGIWYEKSVPAHL